MKQIIAGLIMVLGVAAPVFALSEMVTQYRNDYEFQLEQFRDIYKEYQLKLEQFREVGTFATQEELVQAGRTMLLQRDKTWWTYWQALRAEVLQADGFDEASKQEVAQKMQDEQSFLDVHQSDLKDTTTLTNLKAKSTELEAKNKDYITLAYGSLLELEMAYMKGALSSHKEFSSQIRSAIEVQIRDRNVKAARLRGIDEVNTLLAAAETETNTQIEVLNKKEDRRISAAAFDGFNDDLSPAYLKLDRAHSLLVELSEGIEL